MRGELSELGSGLTQLGVGLYDFTLRVMEPMRLPVDKGSVLRGGFGITFKRTVCVYPGLPPCGGCLLLHRCVYPPIFEPAPPPDAEVLRTHSDVPLAFVIEPPVDGRTQYGAGDALTFRLVLIGQGIGALPYFMVVFQRMGEQGLGPDRARFGLEAVTYVDAVTGERKEILAGGRFAPAAREQGVNAGAVMGQPLPAETRRLTLHFLTPTRLKHEGMLVGGAPAFHVVLRTLLRRLSSLSYFHGGQRWETDYRSWIERAERVTMAGAEVEWYEWTRYSTRQQRRMPLGGVVGRVRYEGEVMPFLPLLRLGELVHVGKAAVFGNGRFVVEVGEDRGQRTEGRGQREEMALDE